MDVEARSEGLGAASGDRSCWGSARMPSPAERRVEELQRDPMTGYEENPDISTVATGSFTARLVGRRHVAPLQAQLLRARRRRPAGTCALRGSRPSTAASRSSSATPACGRLPGSAPACPTPGGTVEGDIDAARRDRPGGAGDRAGAFNEILAAMRAGHAYANVHSTKWPGGEIRAAAREGRGGDHDGQGQEPRDDCRLALDRDRWFVRDRAAAENRPRPRRVGGP